MLRLRRIPNLVPYTTTLQSTLVTVLMVIINRVPFDALDISADLAVSL